MAKINLRMAALAACVGAILAIAPSAQSAVAQTTTDTVCTGAKWDTCSFEQRLTVVKNFCDTTGVSLKDNDKARLAKAKKSEFLGFFGCDDEQPVEVADTNIKANLVFNQRGPTVIRHNHGDADLDRALAQRALQVLGPAPTQNHTFEGVKRRAEPAPRGCQQIARKVQGGTYYRVVCP